VGGQAFVVNRFGVLPPGDSPDDPTVKDIDPVAFALNRTRTCLLWIEEHRASFEAARVSDPAEAERELARLAHTTHEAQRAVARLVELLLAGCNIDPSKRLPRDLQRLAEPNAPEDGGRDPGS
jgi:hypothetical protein